MKPTPGKECACCHCQGPGRHLGQGLESALTAPEARVRLEGMSLEVTPCSREAMADYARAERVKWNQVIKASNIKLD